MAVIWKGVVRENNSSSQNVPKNQPPNRRSSTYVSVFVTFLLPVRHTHNLHRNIKSHSQHTIIMLLRLLFSFLWKAFYEYKAFFLFSAKKCEYITLLGGVAVVGSVRTKPVATAVLSQFIGFENSDEGTCHRRRDEAAACWGHRMKTCKSQA